MTSYVHVAAAHESYLFVHMQKDKKQNVCFFITFNFTSHSSVAGFLVSETVGVKEDNWCFLAIACPLDVQCLGSANYTGCIQLHCWIVHVP